MSEKYVASVTTSIIDKLGVNLYDKASAVITELISNAYDADATEVFVEIPLGERLGWKIDGKIVSSDFSIVVRDNGHGMHPNEINAIFLTIGRNRRLDPKTAVSKKIKRKVMGRKGIGKLAPFGICKQIEVITAGGRKEKGKYRVAHFIMNFDKIRESQSNVYHPDVGKLDETLVDWHGTKVVLSDFMNRTVPDAVTFRRMLARRFGLSQMDFNIYTIDTSPTGNGEPLELSPLDIPIRENTKIDLIDFKSFEFEGIRYPIEGWVAYSQQSYRDEAMTGIRIYVRGKMAAQVRDFNIRSGFTGEYNLRAYLVGVMYADWLDEDDSEDLIQTHRQDIQWGTDIGRAFELWGQELIRQLARVSAEHVSKSRADEFIERSKIDERIATAYTDESIRRSARKFAETIGRLADGDALKEESYVEDLADLTIAIAPHMTLLEKLREAEQLGDKATLEILANLFREIRVADGYSLGQIAKYKVQIIDVLADHINTQDPPPNELVLQNLIETSPWLVYPTWHLISSNETFETFRRNFEGWYRRVYGERIITSTFDAKNGVRPDFLFVHSSEGLLLVEIKKPGHRFDRSDLERLTNYLNALERFFDENSELKLQFPRYQVVLVCDEISLPMVEMRAINDMVNQGQLKKRTWIEVLTETQAIYRDFISAWRAQESMRQRLAPPLIDE